ncbi:hypothetical protein PMAYCL1PPCAC_22343, partial [Pristionchus mayeri]
LPALSIYLCIISSFFSNADQIAYYSIPTCPHVKSGITPVSYTIATWAPQRQLWMISLLLHFPARTLLMMMIPQMWLTGRRWRLSFYVLTSIESLSLACLSLFHKETNVQNRVHVISFTLWWISTILVMGIVTHLKRTTGHINQEAYVYRSWILQIFIMCAFILVSCTCAIAYPLAKKLCSVTAFTCFVVGEYVLIALNPCFWTIVIFEFRREFEGFQVVSVKKR